MALGGSRRPCGLADDAWACRNRHCSAGAAEGSIRLTGKNGAGRGCLPFFRRLEPACSLACELLAGSSTSAIRMTSRLALAVLLLLALANVPARAQAPAPFDGNLQRLAEIMG